jgi:anti-sigma regulatory factor (Ser/Thr protein kinase)
MGSRFTIRAEHPAYAGQIVRSTLIGVHDEAAEVAALLTSELVTKAMVHAQAEPQLFVDTRQGYIYVEVRDPHADPTSPRRAVEPWVPHGRGMTMMNALATSWGVESRDDCDAIWFDLEFSTN